MKGVMQDEPSGNKERFKESVKMPVEPPRRNKKNDSHVEFASKNRMNITTIPSKTQLSETGQMQAVESH